MIGNIDLSETEMSSEEIVMSSEEVAIPALENEVEDQIEIESQMEEPHSVEIAATEAPNQDDEDNEYLFVQLGDRVVIDSTRYGRTVGMVYYRNGERISVKPDGVSNMIHSFAVDNEEETETYEEAVKAVYIIEKRAYESFVEQQDFRVNQLIDTFDNAGEQYQSYKIVAVDKENDTITIQDPEDPEEEREVQFNFVGIESDEPFQVIRIREFVPETDKSQEAPAEVEEGEEEGEEEEEEEEDEFQVVGITEFIPPKVFREAASYEQAIPDHLQKIDALNNFLSVLDPSVQKDPSTIRRVRQEMEVFFHLKQSTIAYREDGSIQGPKATSAATLAELIQSVSVPLGRPVLRIQKKLYRVDDDDEIEEEDVYMEDFENELKMMNERTSPLVSTMMMGSQKGSIVREWQDQQDFLQTFMSPWIAVSKSEPLWNAISDSEVFRWTSPEAETDHTLKPIISGYLARHDAKEVPIFDLIPFGIERALATTYRKGVERRKEVLMPSEKATMSSYLIFPSRTHPYLGAKRSGKLALDSGCSHLPPKTMKMILDEIGAPKEVGTSNDLVLLDAVGTTLGNIPLSSYVDGLTIPALGMGDVYDVLSQYGCQDLEIHEETATILLKKIESYQSQLLSTLAQLRSMIQKMNEVQPVNNPFIEKPLCFEKIKSQPMLMEDVLEYEKQNPTLAESDIGKINHLMKRHANFFQVASGTSVGLIAQAELQVKHDYYLDQLFISNLIRFNRLQAGTPPKKNPCHHVSDLVSVRRIRDDTERFQELAKVFRIYQGARDGNWINCVTCKDHLLCVHERLQLQAFLNMKEKPTIDKEIILSFSGGQFQGKYICRNCGQTIRDMEFDNNLEFDDNGRPKSGSAVIVDKEEEMDEQIDLLLNAPIEPVKQATLELTDSEKVCFTILRDIAVRVGVPFDNDAYRRCLMGVTDFVNHHLPKRAAYGKKEVDYDIYILRYTIAAAAVMLLLEVQTKTPPYVIRYALAGCESPGFEGYPLDLNQENQQGMLYVACAISSYRVNQAPWNQTGFFKVADDKKRQELVFKMMRQVLDKALKNSDIQVHLEQKRDYLTQILGKTSHTDGSRSTDMIPASFLPEQIIITPEEAAQNAIRPEVMNVLGNKTALVKLWIRQSHAIAKESAHLVRGTPRMETTCCTDKVMTPGQFWKSITELPDIGVRQLQPNLQGSFLLTEFHPRAAELGVVEPDKELYYRLFLKYCFQGERKGYLHEPGLTNACIWCGFQFPMHPAVMDTSTEGKAALSSQNITSGTAEFTSLLDTIHKVNDVKPIAKRTISDMEVILTEFANIQPAPLDVWKDTVIATIGSLNGLPKDADMQDIALALSDISQVTSTIDRDIFTRLRAQQYAVYLEEIVNLSWFDFFKVLQNYFITPLQRLLSGFDSGSLVIPYELKSDLSELHIEEGVSKILSKEFEILSSREEDIKKDSYIMARVKLQHMLRQLSATLPFKNKIRPILVPGRELTLVYFQRAILYGVLYQLLDPSIVPMNESDAPIQTLGNQSLVFLLRFIAATLDKYKRESLSFDDRKIKDLIAIRDEKERVNVVEQFNKLSDQERQVELTNKRLGIGKWYVKKKDVYAYNPEYWDLERKKRLEAGIQDFPGMDAALEPLVDEFGFADAGEEDGYDCNQHADDDYE